MKRVTTGHNGSQQKSSGLFQSFCGLSMSVSAPHIIANTFWHIRIEHSADLGIKMIKDAFCLFIERSFRQNGALSAFSLRRRASLLPW